MWCPQVRINDGWFLTGEPNETQQAFKMTEPTECTRTHTGLSNQINDPSVSISLAVVIHWLAD